MTSLRKKFLSLILIVLFVIYIFTFGTSAANSGTCGDNLIWTLSDGTLTISGSGEMNNYKQYSYYSSSAPWLNLSFNNVEIKSGVTSIGRYAFYNCTSLTSITIPDSVTSIGDNAFYNTAYYNNEDNWDNGVLYIGNHLIKAKNTLAEYSIREGTKTVAPSAFYGCASLTSITIPSSVTSIGSYAFYDCSKLTSITIPDSVTNIGSFAFYNTAYYNNESNWDNGVLYIGNHLIYAKDKSITECSIREGTKTIAGEAFSFCQSLTSITIPDGVTSIGDSAFSGCTSLTSVTIPDSVTSIGVGAFYDSASLTSITIPDSVTSIGNSAFFDCSSLTSVTIPDSVTSIGNYAFYDCSSLTSVTIPDSVTCIGNSAFYNCTSLTSITIPDSVTSIGGGAFDGCSSLTSITIPDSVKSIGGSTFYNTAYYNNESNWYNGVLYIGNHLIEAKNTISKCFIREGTKTIVWGAFSGCTSIISVTIPDSVMRIDAGVFSSCSSLVSITVEPGNPVFHSSGNCLINTKNKEIIAGCNNSIIPDDGSVTSIGDSAFRSCSSLRSITIPDGVTSIGDYAFGGCSKLTSITIPDSVTSIGYEAFYGCTSLTSITIPDGVTSIGDSAFSGCSSLKTVYYQGSKADRENIAIGAYNDDLMHAEWVYNVVKKQFTDVEAGKWYTEAVSYVVNKGLFNGTSETTFSPNADMTRSMLVSVLYRMEDSPEVAFKNIFSDVKNGTWYSSAVIWAEKYEIVTGVGQGKFDPNGKVTREQLATILYRYSQYKGKDVSASANLNTFSDGGTTSSWAKTTMQWAVAEGLISGTGNNMLSPKGNASRAQVATILMRYLTNS